MSRDPQALQWWAGKATARAFMAWEAASVMARERRVAKHQAAAVYNGLLARKTLLAWTDYLLCKRQRDVRLLLAMQHLARMRLCTCFDGWWVLLM